MNTKVEEEVCVWNYRDRIEIWDERGTYEYGVIVEIIIIRLRLSYLSHSHEGPHLIYAVRTHTHVGAHRGNRGRKQEKGREWERGREMMGERWM